MPILDRRGWMLGALGLAAPVALRAQPAWPRFVLVFDSHVVNPALNPTLGFDPAKDLRASCWSRPRRC